MIRTDAGRLAIRHLACALTLARHGNFGRAAEELGIAQPTLSRIIQSLEDRVGGKLFDRLPREVVPTTLGEVLLARAEAIVDATRELEDELAAVLGLDSGLLRVAVGPYAAAVLIGSALARLLERHPGLQVDLIEVDSDRMASVLLAGEVSVVVGEMSVFGDDPDFEVEPLRVRTGEFVCRCGHPILENPPRTLAELLRWPLATTRIEAAAWRRIAAGSSRADRPGELAETAWTVRSQNLTVIARLVAGSDAIGIFSRGMIRRELADGTLAVVPFEGTKPTSNWGLVWRRGRTPSPAALAFLQAVRDADAAVPVD